MVDLYDIHQKYVAVGFVVSPILIMSTQYAVHKLKNLIEYAFINGARNTITGRKGESKQDKLSDLYDIILLKVSHLKIL